MPAPDHVQAEARAGENHVGADRRARDVFDYPRTPRGLEHAPDGFNQVRMPLRKPGPAPGHRGKALARRTGKDQIPSSQRKRKRHHIGHDNVERIAARPVRVPFNPRHVKPRPGQPGAGAAFAAEQVQSS